MDESSNNFGSESSDDEFTQTQNSSESDENDKGICKGREFLESNGIILPPTVGMEFPSWEEAEAYYMMYGKQEGFEVVRAIRENGAKMSERKSFLWKCEYHGKPDCRRVNSKRVCTQVGNRKMKKCECPALMNVVLLKKVKVWVVKRVVLQHNDHTLMTSVSAAKRKLNEGALGVNTPEFDGNLARGRNGVESMETTREDMHNVIDKGRRLKLRDGDANALKVLFTELSSNGQNFFHMHRFDEFGLLKDVMWVDARSRAAYEEFGDVVLVDSTCLTDDYELPLVNFVGVNHHGKSILLGCALLSHEDADTYQWLFSTWLLCMNGKPPAGILTDQSAEMRDALLTVMPNTQHRWYLGYVLQRFYKKLRLHERYSELKEAFFGVIYGSSTPGEFENSWRSTLKEFKLESNDLLTGLYEERRMWVPAYMKHFFWAGMITSKRVQSVKNFFAGHMGKHTRFYEFVTIYCYAMGSQAFDEVKADLDERRRQILIPFLVNVEFEKVYTDAKFLEVLSECSKLYYDHVLEKKCLPNQMVEYTIEDRAAIMCQAPKKKIRIEHEQTYKVVFNTSSNEAYCDCKLFECEGILCSHIIRVYHIQHIPEVPSKYILDRWRKDIRRKHAPVKVAYHDPYISSKEKRYEKMMDAFKHIAQKACTCEENMTMVFKSIQSLDIQLNEKIAATKRTVDQASGMCHT